MKSAHVPGFRKAAVAGLIGLAAVVTVAMNLEIQVRRQSEGFWDALYFDGASSPHYDSLTALVQASDVVVLGRIEAVTEGRVFGNPHPANPNPEEELVRYVTATVRVDEVLQGRLEDPGSNAIKLELPMPDPKALGELTGNPPSENGVFFVFNAGRMAAQQGRPAAVQETERQYYSLVAFGAVVRDFGGKAAPIDAPELQRSLSSPVRHQRSKIRLATPPSRVG